MGAFSLPSLQFPSIDAAIAQYEGYGASPGNLPTRQNNPGNLKYGDFAAQYGGVRGSGGFASFPDVQSGVAAMDALVATYAARGYTQDQMIAAWNGNGANTGQYQQFVADKTGNPGSGFLSKLGKLLPWVTPFAGSPDVGGAREVGSDVVTRFVAGLLGVICIIAGLIFMRSTHQIVVNAGRKVKDAALLAA